MKQTLCVSILLVWSSFGGGIARAQPDFGVSDIVGGAFADEGWPLEDPCSFTQNEEFDLINGAVACSGGGITTDNQFLRRRGNLYLKCLRARLVQELDYLSFASLCDATEGTCGVKNLLWGTPILFLLFPRNEKYIGNTSR